MPFELIRNDITTMKVDAIVNSANPSLLGGGGLDGAVHRAAGPGLAKACARLHGCNTGEARITRGYHLPARYVIHTVGPVWHGGDHGEAEMLASCYRSSLELAQKHRCRSIAFPLIATHAYGFPKDQAMTIALDVISRFLMDHDMMIYLVLFGSTEFLTGRRLYRDVREYVDDRYVQEHVNDRLESRREQLWQKDEKAGLQLDLELGAAPDLFSEGSLREDAFSDEAFPDAAPSFSESAFSSGGMPAAPMAAPPEKREKQRRDAAQPMPDLRPKKAASPSRPVHAPSEAPMAAPPDWDKLLSRTDEGFSESLLRLIDEKGMTDTECYKRANFDRKLFSKIRSNPAYRPTKPTVFAFAVALRLSLGETRDLLERAGFALTHSSRFDIIMEYFILNGIYDIYEINEVLFQFDMPLLGSTFRS